MLALTHDTSADPQKDGMLNGLFRDCIYGICLRMRKQVLATHQELAILRRCADLLQDQSTRIIYVVATANKQKTNFIVNTLMHLGVSCGQIRLSPASGKSQGANDIWLFVADC